MTDPLFLSPAQAIAVSRCLLARLWEGGRPLGLSVSHPRPCAWEDVSRDELAGMLADFNHDAGHDARWDRYRHPDVERFRSLPRDEQERRIAAAQYPETEEAA